MTDQRTVEEQLLDEQRRTRQATEGIRILLTIWMVVFVLAVIIWFAYAL